VIRQDGGQEKEEEKKKRKVKKADTDVLTTQRGCVHLTM
jgi:hypothetical protein